MIHSALISLSLAVISYSVYISWLVLRDVTLSRTQRVGQMFIVWFAPLIGAAFVHWVNYGQTRKGDAPSRKYRAADSYEDIDSNLKDF